MEKQETILVTGTGGFIGYHLSKELLSRGHKVVGVDLFNDYYPVCIKEARSAELKQNKAFTEVRIDICDGIAFDNIFKNHDIDKVCHLAAQAGVRYSLSHPMVYEESNLKAFLNVLESVRHNKIKRLVYASSSSVYGGNTKVPFAESDRVDNPVSLYAATKKANELMAHSYAELYGIPCTGLRFFTVYGPWGRPDMALFIFTRAILEGKPIDVYNRGNTRRDFTYIDDIVEGVVRVIDKIPQPDPRWDKFHPDPGGSFAPYRIYNIGNNRPVLLTDFIGILEDCLGRRAVKNMLPLQPGDVVETCADVDELMRDVGFRPKTPIEEGIKKFIAWYRSYYG